MTKESYNFGVDTEAKRLYTETSGVTAKRFENRLNKDNIKFNTLNPVWDNEKQDALNVFEMIDMLNHLHEENNELRLMLNLCSDQRDEFYRGARENANRVGKLKEENEQLKEQLKIYKNDGLETLNDLEKVYENNKKALSNIEQLDKENNELKQENQALKERNKKLYTEIFEIRTNIALEQTEINRETYTAKKSTKEFLDDLEKW